MELTPQQKDILDRLRSRGLEIVAFPMFESLVGVRKGNCAALLAPVIEANVRALRSGPPGHPALERYAQAARLLTGDDAASIQDGVAWIRETLALLAVPGLAAFGIGPQQAGDIAARAIGSSSMQGNPVPLSTDALQAIVAQAL